MIREKLLETKTCEVFNELVERHGRNIASILAEARKKYAEAIHNRSEFDYDVYGHICNFMEEVICTEFFGITEDEVVRLREKDVEELECRVTEFMALHLYYFDDEKGIWYRPEIH